MRVASAAATFVALIACSLGLGQTTGSDSQRGVPNRQDEYGWWDEVAEFTGFPVPQTARATNARVR